jgi:hypothetical protein
MSTPTHARADIATVRNMLNGIDTDPGTSTWQGGTQHRRQHPRLDPEFGVQFWLCDWLTRRFFRVPRSLR